jgi:tRNA pseudouridine13 synthase
MFQSLDAGQRQRLAELTLPLPSARLRLEPGDGRLPFVLAVMAEEGLQLNQLKVQGVRDLFFARGERAVVVKATRLHYEDREDDCHPTKHKLLLCFELPRGSYATLVVKRISL